MPTKTAKKNKVTTKSVKTPAPVVEEEDEDLDLEDLEDLDDFEDEDFEDEDEEEDEEPEPVKVKASKTKTATATKTAKGNGVKSAKRTGNPSNLKPVRYAEGMVNAGTMAAELKIEPKQLRMYFRQLAVAKDDSGIYQWKPGSKTYKETIKQVEKAIKAKSN